MRRYRTQEIAGSSPASSIMATAVTLGRGLREPRPALSSVWMTKKYRSPRGRTPGAAAAPTRLAEAYDGYAVWSDRPDGSLEVATVRGGCLYRHRVHLDGTTSIIDHDPHPPSSHWAALSYAGFGFNLLILAGMVTGQLSSHSFPLFLMGMAVMAVGALANAQATDPVRRLRRNPATAGEWHEPPRLSGWAPRTCAQLEAVERLADEHNGMAQVREAAGDTVEVVARHWGRRRYYLVDDLGHAARATIRSIDSGARWHEVRTIEEDTD